MDKTGLTLTNSYGVTIGLSLEPEGTLYELKPNESIEVEISSGVSPAIDIRFEKNPTGVYISLWSDKGEYQIEKSKIFS